MTLWVSSLKLDRSILRGTFLSHYVLKKVVLYWLIRRKARVRIPGQASKRNMKKKIFFLRRFPLNRFLCQKTLWELINLPWKSLLKICRSESTLNCRSRRSRIKLTHTTWVVWEGRQSSWPKGCNGHLWVYVCLKPTLEDGRCVY